MGVVECIRSEHLVSYRDFNADEVFDLIEAFARTSDMQPDMHECVLKRTSCQLDSSREDVLELACTIALRKGWENVNWRRNFSALHLAAKLGETEVAKKLLLEANATAGLRLLDNHGKTPLDYALALPKIDLELLALLDPTSETNSMKPRQKCSTSQRRHSAPRPRKSLSTHCASEAKTRSVAEQSFLDSIPLEPRSAFHTRASSLGRIAGAQRNVILPSLLGSNGLVFEGKLPHGESAWKLK
jgi:hypothetical protein